MNAVQANSLSFAHDATPILRGINLAARPGSIHMIIGPNGSGKTTLLRLLASILRPSAGEIQILGKSAQSYSPRLLAQAVAHLPQVLPKALPLTVRELVLLGRTPHQGLLGRASRADLAAAETAMRQADVPHLADILLGNLSGGEYQRAHIAKALCQQPSVLLLDEPTASLDPGHGLKVMELVCTLRDATGLCAVISSHDLNLTVRYADQVTLLHAGRAVCQGPPDRVLVPEQLEPVYNCGFIRLGTEKGLSALVPTLNVATTEQA